MRILARTSTSIVTGLGVIGIGFIVTTAMATPATPDESPACPSCVERFKAPLVDIWTQNGEGCSGLYPYREKSHTYQQMTCQPNNEIKYEFKGTVTKGCINVWHEEDTIPVLCNAGPTDVQNTDP